MQIDFTLIGIALATMFFGYFFGLFEGRRQGYRKREKQEAEEKQNMPSHSPPASARVDDPSLLRLKDESGQLLLELDGQRLSTGRLSAEQKKRLIGLLTLMRPWLEGTPPPAPPPTARVVEQAAPVQRKDVVGEGRAAIAIPEEEKPEAPLSIVGQIDSILQRRMMNTPLAGKGVRLQESLQGNVVVWVGVTKYTSVDEVPDAEIKGAIRAAIAEWEEKFTPGI